MAWDLQKVSKFSILNAKLSAENQLIHNRLMQIKDAQKTAPMKQALQLQYASLIQKLLAWESSVKSYHAAISATVANRSAGLKEVALEKIKKARTDFQKTRDEWNILTKSWMLETSLA